MTAERARDYSGKVGDDNAASPFQEKLTLDNPILVHRWARSRRFVGTYPWCSDAERSQKRWHLLYRKRKRKGGHSQLWEPKQSKKRVSTPIAIQAVLWTTQTEKEIWRKTLRRDVNSIQLERKCRHFNDNVLHHSWRQVTSSKSPFNLKREPLAAKISNKPRYIFPQTQRHLVTAL